MAHLKTISIATLALGALAGTAMADFTAIVGAGQGFASNEGNQAQTPNIRNMLSNIYGGAFTLVSNGRTDTGGNSVDFSNGSATGSIIARRISDFVAGAGGARNVGSGLNVHGSSWNSAGVTDQNWLDGTVGTTTEAKFAGDHEEHIGTLSNTLPTGTYDHRFAATSNGYNPSTTFYGANPRTVPGGADGFQWIRSQGVNGSGQPSGAVTSSLESANASSQDAQVTYELLVVDSNGNYVPYAGSRSWVIFCEDRPNGDRDFNDVVFQVTAITAVPTPTAALAGLGTLGLAGIGSIVRRRRQTAM